MCVLRQKLKPDKKYQSKTQATFQNLKNNKIKIEPKMYGLPK